ncbi:MAG TPA: LytR C-terminal domain-containing protein, partial [Baekduia sp.]|nr:LytR C-terminal domain-containing protein [Baekduia sp.]
PTPPRRTARRRSWSSRPAIFGAIGAIVVVLVVAVLLLTNVLGGDDSPTQKANTIGTPGQTTARSDAATKSKTTAAPAAALKPGSYEVAVLNGTTVPNLARGVANRLQQTKYRIGNVTNAAAQDRSATLVEFAPGHRAEADSVAKAIDVGSDAIQPLSAGSKTIAGERAAVVVTVGADQNTLPQQQTTTP